MELNSENQFTKALVGVNLKILPVITKYGSDVAHI